MRKTEYNPQAINFTSAFEPQTIDSQGMLGLHDLVRYTKLLGVSELEFSDDISMREFKSELEKHILEEVHPYRIYESGRAKDQCITLADTLPQGKDRQDGTWRHEGK